MMKFFAWLNAGHLALKTAHHGLLWSYILNLFWTPILAAIASFAIGALVINYGGPALFWKWVYVIVGGPLLLLGLYTFIELGREYQRRETEKHHRGRVMLKEDAARKEARKKRAPDDPGVMWGKLKLPTPDAMMHFCIIGGIGSGKTLTMQILMNDQLKHLTPGSDRRALIFDSKEDFVQIVAGINPPCPLHILNPFDKRRTAWDIASDVNYPPVARNFSAMIFPVNPQSHNKFYEETPQAILTAVLNVFILRASKKWTLRHLVLVMKSKELIEQITSLDDDSRATMKLAFDGSDKSLGDVMSTINSKLSPYADIAASWETATKTISVTEWLTATSILILPKYGAAESETFRVYSAFINILSSHLSMLTPSETRRTWIFLDEFTQLKKVEGLSRLVLEGRDKGFTCVIGTQQPGLVHDAYGKEQGEALISECGNKCYLKAQSETAANWVASSINEFVPDWEQSEDAKGPDESFPPRYFMTLPKAGFTNGLSGVYLSPSVAGWSAKYTPEELRSLISEPAKHIDRFQRLDTEFLRLKAWSKEDSELFGIPWPLPAPPSEAKEQSPKPTPPTEDDPLDGMVEIRP